MSDQTQTNFTRVRFHVQRGDGPDRRGDVTVEVSGSLDEGTPTSVREEAEEQLDEAQAHLEESLGLDG